MTLSLKAMTYFTAALRHGNIAGAAAELNIAASAVASAIDQVETAFDLKLVTRQRARGIAPTASGRTIARKCERLLEDHRTLMTEGAQLREAAAGPLRIGYYAPVAPAFLPAVLSSIGAAPGAIDLHLRECDNHAAQDGLLSGAFDAILFVSNEARPAIAHDILIDAPPYCLVPCGHPFARQQSVSLAQISAHPLVVLDRPFAAGYYRDLVARTGAEPVIAASANSTEMVRSLVSQGLGCAILNMTPRTAQTYTGAEVVAVPMDAALPALSLSVGYDKVRPRRLVRDFARACRSYFAATGEGACTVFPPV